MTPKSGDDSLYLTCEDGSKHNKHAVAVIIGGSTGGNVTKTLSKTVSLFLTLAKSLGNVLIEELNMD